jgi:hypothetical protein
MIKWRTITAALMLIVVISAFALVWRATAPREPIYKGKPLTYWLDQAYGDGNWTEVGEAEAHEALLAAGTNAIPILLLDLQARDRPLMDRLSDLLGRVGFKKYFGSYACDKNLEGVIGFEVLGTQAKDSVPTLAGIYKRHISPASEVAAIKCLGSIGPEARAAIPTLVSALANRANFGQNYSAAAALGAIHSEPEVVVPVLTDFLKTDDNSFRFALEKALQRFGSEAKPAMPELLSLLKDPQQTIYFRQQAYKTIQAISPEDAAKIPPEILKGLE